MKKIISLILACVLIVTVFVGCSKESEAVNGTTDEPTTVQTVDETVDKLTEDVNVENTTTDKDGNEVIVGTDKDGNTVEIKTEPDGKITKTVTDKETGKKTEQTTKTTTAPSTTESKKKSDKKPVTTTKPQTTKPKTTEKQTATKKPAPQQTTTHTHNWQPVYKTRKVCVKEAYTEPVTATVPKTTDTYHCVCGAWFNKTNSNDAKRDLSFHVRQNNGPNDKHKDVGYFTMEPIPGEYETITTGSISYPAVYKDEKYIASYKCSECGKTKSV